MNTQSSTSDIEIFINNLKNLMSENKYDFVPRRKNLQDLAEYGLSIKDAKSEIISLEVSDYYKGPKKDLNTSKLGDIWEFKKNIDGVQFYIKLKIVQENNENILKCLSFHKDDFI